MNLQLLDLDIYDDRELSIYHNIRGEMDTGLFDKCASQISLLSPEQLEALRDDQFALRILTKNGHVIKKFPISDPEQTWLSSVYFAKTASQLPNMAQAVAASGIAHASNIWGLEPPYVIQKIAEHYPMRGDNLWVEGHDFEVPTEPFDMAKIAEISRDPSQHDNRYWGLTNGKLRYELKTPEQVKVAAAYLNNNERAFTPEERFEFASKIAARAHEYGMVDEVNQTPVLHKYAGYGLGGERLTHHLARKQTFNEIDEISREELEKTSHMAKLASLGFGDRLSDNLRKRRELGEDLHIETQPYDELEKTSAELGPAQTAQALVHLDKHAGLSRYWDKSIDDPFAAVYGTYHIKTATEYTVFGDQKLSKTDLLSISAKDFVSRFGESMYNEFQRHPLMIFESMPTPEKGVIASMIDNPKFLDASEM